MRNFASSILAKFKPEDVPEPFEPVSEFELIEKFFAPLADNNNSFGLKDDAALLDKWVITTDTIVSGVHFLGTEPADMIARKLLRTNLSDLAAKGAKPKFYSLALTLPKNTHPDWVEKFAAGLRADQQEFGVSLIGGDTTSTDGNFVATITAIGEAPAGGMIKRSGANVGDYVYVTGTIGDAALGLIKMKLSNGIFTRGFLEQRYMLPEPRVEIGVAIAEIASASIDISDGLVADAGHIAAASDVGIEIEAGQIPLSGEALGYLGKTPSLLDKIISGGDDYELFFTISPKDERVLHEIAIATSTSISRIGRVVAGDGVKVLTPDGAIIEPKTTGYKHF